MKGTKHLRVRGAGCVFTMDLRRNITVIAGKSGTGKTTLFELVAAHTRAGDRSGVTVECPDARDCVALVDVDWRNQLSNTHESIVFVDEGFEPIATREFAVAIDGSDNYFVLITRVSLHELSYSVDQVFRMRTSGRRYHTLEPLYKPRGNHRYQLSPRKRQADLFDVVLVEDSRAGFEFYQARLEGTGVACETSFGCSGVFRWLQDHPDTRVLVIADGAAFGAEADRVLKLQDQRPRLVGVCLPESFEWLILASRLVRADDLEAVLADPAAHIDCAEHKSWERFFTRYLEDISRGTPFEYSKGRLADAYRDGRNAERIIAEVANGNVA